MGLRHRIERGGVHIIMLDSSSILGVTYGRMVVPCELWCASNAVGIRRFPVTPATPRTHPDVHHAQESRTRSRAHDSRARTWCVYPRDARQYGCDDEATIPGAHDCGCGIFRSAGPRLDFRPCAARSSGGERRQCGIVGAAWRARRRGKVATPGGLADHSERVSDHRPLSELTYMRRTRPAKIEQA